MSGSNVPVSSKHVGLAQVLRSLGQHAERRSIRVAAAGIGVLAVVGLLSLALTQMFGANSAASEDASRAAMAAAASSADAAAVNEALSILAPSNGRDGAPLVLAAGKALFPLPINGSLTEFENAPLEAHDVRVSALSPSSTGFAFIDPRSALDPVASPGQAAAQSVWVNSPLALADNGSVPVAQLHIGDLVIVSGHVAALADRLVGLGATPEIVPVLQKQGEFVAADSVRRVL